jgi:hypothetical protein
MDGAPALLQPVACVMQQKGLQAHFNDADTALTYALNSRKTSANEISSDLNTLNLCLSQPKDLHRPLE